MQQKKKKKYKQLEGSVVKKLQHCQNQYGAFMTCMQKCGLSEDDYTSFITDLTNYTSGTRFWAEV